jgi:hypothetical protein
VSGRSIERREGGDTNTDTYLRGIERVMSVRPLLQQLVLLVGVQQVQAPYGGVRAAVGCDGGEKRLQIIPLRLVETGKHS